ncbi:MAG: hypothetical protein ACTTKW_04730 [Schwartzia sp. (in: firmicutes)]
MTSVFSVRRAVGLVLAAALWLTAGRAAAEALPLSPSEAAGGSFLRFSLSSAVDRSDGSVAADFLLWDGDRPVPKEELEVLSAVCRCRAEEEAHVLPLTVKEDEESAVFRLVLPRRASCNVIAKLRYRGQLYVVQVLRTIYARGRDPAEWPQAAMPTDTPYIETASEEGYNFRTGQPMAFTFRQGSGRPTAVAVYDKERRFLETLTAGDAFAYEVTPLPRLHVPGRGSRDEVFFAALLEEGGEPLHLFAQISVVHDHRLYLDVLHGVAVLLAAGGVTGAFILLRRRKRRRGA